MAESRAQYWKRLYTAQSCEGERLRAAICELWTIADTSELEPEMALFVGGVVADEMEPASEGLPPDTCPECHGTGKTVIRKEIGVENCPECGRV